MMHRTTTLPDCEDELVIDRQHMPYQLDEGIGYRARIGLIVLATDQTIEYEFRQPRPGVALPAACRLRRPGARLWLSVHPSAGCGVSAAFCCS
jgi:hypothetical protein